MRLLIRVTLISATSESVNSSAKSRWFQIGIFITIDIRSGDDEFPLRVMHLRNARGSRRQCL
jgi:hypothetical protein